MLPAGGITPFVMEISEWGASVETSHLAHDFTNQSVVVGAAVKIPLLPGQENSALFGAGDPEINGLTPCLES